MYSPYNLGNQYYLQNPNIISQQIIQVNGKASVDTIQLAPNSSILVMDTSAPIVWMCVSDGVGRVTSTPYSISPYIEKDEQALALEDRLQKIEASLKEMENLVNVKSNDVKSEQKQNITNGITD